MSFSNTQTSYGSVARVLHWLMALLILTAIPLGLIANDMAADPASIATKASLFSIHKTIGVAAFLIGLARILWALSQSHPAPLHPERRLETWLAALVHWSLYIAMMALPLTGWIEHAALDGFAPILWPFGQDLPFVAKSAATAELFATLHEIFGKVLMASITLHILGALKHHLIDRDATLTRMTRGTSVATPPAPRRSATPMLVALAIYALGAAATYALMPATPETETATASAPTAASAGNWQVSEGSLGFSVKQMGAAVDGSFASWKAEIQFDDKIAEGEAGSVTTTIDLASVNLGSVTDQVKSADILDVASHPTAIFKAKILRKGDSYTAEGTLSLHGVEKPLSLPFTLKIEGDSAQMQGETGFDRRDFQIGAAYKDESTVGFPITVKIALTAKRQ
jgi:cytochrome b561/polyisoprenoid-binding protein YceI